MGYIKNTLWFSQRSYHIPYLLQDGRIHTYYIYIYAYTYVYACTYVGSSIL